MKVPAEDCKLDPEDKPKQPKNNGRDTSKSAKIKNQSLINIRAESGLFAGGASNRTSLNPLAQAKTTVNNGSVKQITSGSFVRQRTFKEKDS